MSIASVTKQTRTRNDSPAGEKPTRRRFLGSVAGPAAACCFLTMDSPASLRREESKTKAGKLEGKWKWEESDTQSVKLRALYVFNFLGDSIADGDVDTT